MTVFTDRAFKSHLATLAAALALLAALGQLMVYSMTSAYKQNMITHDYGIAGYLARNGVDQVHVVEVLTSHKSSEDIVTGSRLLEASGYTSSVQTNLLLEVERFRHRFSFVSFGLTTVFSAAILLAVLRFEARRTTIIEEAIAKIQGFVAGHTHIRLDDLEEGALWRLFSSVNALATAQVAHIEKEQGSREFLRDTISDISHQLKTPLAALSMYNEIVQDEGSRDGVIGEFVLKSQREIARIETLTRNLLRLAKLDAGAFRLEKRTHGLRRFLEEALSGFSTRANLEGKEMRLLCDDAITLAFDNEWLLEAVSNIIKNALDHTGSNGQIEVSCEETPVLTVIAISDNGTGIHPEDIHHIFKRFYRSRFSKDSQGVGIGLALSKAIVETHGGSITVESQLGHGASFRLFFPRLSHL